MKVHLTLDLRRGYGNWSSLKLKIHMSLYSWPSVYGSAALDTTNWGSCSDVGGIYWKTICIQVDLQSSKSLLFKSQLNIVVRFLGEYWKTVVVSSLNFVRLFVTPWTAACQGPLTSTTSQSLLKFRSIWVGDTIYYNL